MSFCPSKDLHSVYLDNELPENYKAEYEAHVNNCPQCKKQLEELRVLRSLFQADSKAITPDSHYLDQSYERLMVKMQYAKHTSASRKVFPRVNVKSLSYVGSAVAAAAVFALVIPFGLKSAKKIDPAKTAAVLSAASYLTNSVANNVAVNSGRSVVISGNIDDAVVTSVNNYGNLSSVAQNVSMNSNSAVMDSSMIKKVEVFHPDINNSQTISIRVTMPGMDSAYGYKEFTMPVSVILGR